MARNFANMEDIWNQIPLDYYCVVRASRISLNERPVTEILCQVYPLNNKKVVNFFTLGEINKFKCMPVCYPTEETAEASRVMYNTKKHYSQVVRKTESAAEYIILLERGARDSLYLGRETLARSSNSHRNSLLVFSYCRYKAVRELSKASRFSPLECCEAVLFKKRVEEIKPSINLQNVACGITSVRVMRMEEFKTPSLELSEAKQIQATSFLEATVLKRKAYEEVLYQDEAVLAQRSPYKKRVTMLKKLEELSSTEMHPKSKLCPFLLLPGLPKEGQKNEEEMLRLVERRVDHWFEDRAVAFRHADLFEENLSRSVDPASLSSTSELSADEEEEIEIEDQPEEAQLPPVNDQEDQIPYTPLPPSPLTFSLSEHFSGDNDLDDFWQVPIIGDEAM